MAAMVTAVTVKAATVMVKAAMARMMRKKPKKQPRKHLQQNVRGCARLKICVAISELIPVHS